MQFQDNIVAGSSSDFMEVRHLQMRGSNYDIGKKLAEIARDRHSVRKTPYTDPLRSRAQLLFLEKNYPIHLERMRGVADAYGIDLDDSSVDLAHLNYQMGIPGCSVVYYPPNSTHSGHGILSRNFDFPTGTFHEAAGIVPEPDKTPTASRPYIMEVYPDTGYPSLYISLFDLLGSCIDGINSEGLTVALLSDYESIGKRRMEPAELNGVGLAEIQITRLLLDKCANIDEAKSVLLTTKQYYRFIPCHYIIADRHGNSFVWEYSCFHNREHIIDGKGEPQVVTNHPLHRYESLDKLPKHKSRAHTYNRFRALTNALAGHEGRFSSEFIWETNRCAHVESNPSSRENGKTSPPWRTLWHNVYDIDNRSFEIDFYLGDRPDADDTGSHSPVRSERLQFKLDS